MKCISLWQPWASLWVCGAKVHETRGRAMHCRGPLGVHAALHFTWAERTTMFSPPFASVLRWNEADADALMEARMRATLGHIIGIVDVVDCVQITADNAPPFPDRHFGDYTPGRYMIRAENPRALVTPIPFKGAQGIFNVPDELIESALKGVS